MSAKDDLADVWVIDLVTLTAADVARCAAVLSPAESDRLQRLHFDADRTAFCAVHALARIALSSIEEAVPPSVWIFDKTPEGRPEISAGSGLPRLRFNLSHTRGAVACIVTRDLDCGVDIEATGCWTDLEAVSRTVLAPSELAAIAAVPDPERATLFLRYWTLKEAYAKGLGLGLSMRFDRIAFKLCEEFPRSTLIQTGGISSNGHRYRRTSSLQPFALPDRFASSVIAACLTTSPSKRRDGKFPDLQSGGAADGNRRGVVPRTGAARDTGEPDRRLARGVVTGLGADGCSCRQALPACEREGTMPQEGHQR